MVQGAFEKLPCKLTAAEKAAKSDELAAELQRRAELELEKQLLSQRLAKSIKQSARKVSNLAEEVRTGIEYREIGVVERVAGQRMETLRVDTRAVVHSRPLEAHERQRSLFDADGVVTDDDEVDDDESAETGDKH
jgi:hypothetical protein